MCEYNVDKLKQRETNSLTSEIEQFEYCFKKNGFNFKQFNKWKNSFY